MSRPCSSLSSWKDSKTVFKGLHYSSAFTGCVSPLHSHSRQSEALKVNPAVLCGVNHLPSTQCPQLAPQIDAAEEEVAELGGDYLEEN